MDDQNDPTTSYRQQRLALQRRQERIRNSLLILGGVFILLAALSFFLNNSSSQSVGPVRVGSSVGDFALSDLNGNTVHLSDYAGKAVMINAWATWCPPCRAEMPLLNSYYLTHRQQGFVILAVNAGDSRSEAASFAQQNGLAFTVLLDPNTQLLNSLGIHDYPTSVFIGSDGIVKAIHVGMFTEDSIESEITPLLSQ